METPKYTIARYDALVESTFAEIVRLGIQKGGEYAADTDRLDNFRRNAAAWGVTLEQCWGVYAGKHWDALQTYIRDQAVGKERVRTEPISGRIDDLIVYLLLLKARVDEIENPHVQTKLPLMASVKTTPPMQDLSMQPPGGAKSIQTVGHEVRAARAVDEAMDDLNKELEARRT